MLSDVKNINKILKIDVFAPISIEFSTSDNYIGNVIYNEIMKSDS